MNKRKDLIKIIGIYLLAYAAGLFSCLFFEGETVRYFMFDTTATVVTFIFSVFLKNSSVYDAYWSLTPMVMSVWIFAANQAFSFYQLLFLVIFNIWSIRLTGNWISVFTDFSYEDWRYRKFRNETPRELWPFVNFFGIHYMPTLIVFLAMLPMFRIAKNPLGFKSLPGMMVILIGVLLEYLADKDMHQFLKESNGEDVCTVGLWKYSRHPNYLGEITVWLGVYLTLLPYDAGSWNLYIGFVAVAVMFNVISIPLMERRQLAKRPTYKEYTSATSRLLILPRKGK